MKQGRIMGILVLDILEDDGKVFDKFESAFRFAVKNYIEPTTIGFNLESLIFKKKDGEIIVEYRYDGMDLKYEIGQEGQEESSSSIQFEADFGRGLFEYLAKFVVVTFLEDQLSVRTQHTQVTYTGARMIKSKTI